MTAPAPHVSRDLRLPLVWIVPLLALIVGGWMMFRQLRHRGPLITIEFADGSGVAAGKTQVEHNGAIVGVVRAVELKEDLSGVSVQVRLDRHAAALASEGAQFWIVHPEFGIGGIRGLDTLLTGPKINVRPGRGPRAERFRGLERAPPRENPTAGRAFVLQADRLGSLRPGAPVFYREVKVGAVETSKLADDAASVLVRVRILTPYVDLVRANTVFWNAGGASLRISLLGAEVKSTSLESLLIGGIALATPDAPAPVAEDGALFKLHSEADKDWLKWQPRIPIHPPDEAPEPVAPSGPLAPFAK